MKNQIYRALVVDDEPHIREATARAMGAHSFWCETAIDGEDALRKYHENRHDLVVSDLRMPNKHGHQLVMELLGEKDPPRVVILTAVAEPLLVKDLYSRGVSDVIQKPVDYGVFATKMQSLFECKTWQDSLRSAERSRQGTAGNNLVAKIDSSLELLSLCVPESAQKALEVDADLLHDPPKAVENYMRRQIVKMAADVERRHELRESLFVNVVAIPVNRDFDPIEAPFKMAARDYSESSICLLHTRAANAEYLALRWRSLALPGCFIRVVVRVTQCRPVGPFYEVVGEFVMRD